MPQRKTTGSPAISAISKEVVRERVATWFEATKAARVRILSAPVGCGKTFAIKQYAARRKGATAYVHVPASANAQALGEMLSRGRKAGEIILDGIDQIDPSVYAAFVDEIAEGRVDAKLVLVGRSRRKLHAQALLARGFAAAYDPPALAFDAREIAALAAAFGVAFDDDDVSQVLYDSEGWAIAAEWLIRDAAETGRTLRDAFGHWRERYGHLLVEFIENEYRDDAVSFETFYSLLGSRPGEGRQELERLEQAGFPLVRTRTGARPYRVLRRLVAASQGIPTDRASATLPPLMMLNMLGRFRCEIAGVPVAFSRRRDQNVFAFVALAPGGRVTREVVLDTFWSGIDHRIAAQGLRTTLSRIRRAIAEAVSGFDAELYFHTEGELQLDPATVAVDVWRFVDLVEQGRFDDALGATDGAKRHYRLAYCTYHDRLLASEPPEPCFERSVKSLDAMYLEALSRLMQLHAAVGDLETAREYAREYSSATVPGVTA